MKLVHTLVSGLIVAMCTSGAVRAGDVIEVSPVGNPNPTHVHPLLGNPCTEDVYNVQNALLAVEPGGTVILKAGRFEFGEQLIQINPDKPGVTLAGEGMHRTVVGGGGSGYYFNFYFTVLVMANGVKVRDLTFDGPTGVTMCIVPYNISEENWEPIEDFESVRVRIINPHPSPVSGFRAGWHPIGTTGKVVIKNCIFEVSEPTANFDHAVNALWFWVGTTDVEITDNLFKFDYVPTDPYMNMAIQVGTPPSSDAVVSAKIRRNKVVGGVGLYVHNLRGKVDICFNHISAKHTGIWVSTSPDGSESFVVRRNYIYMSDGPDTSAAMRCGGTWTSPLASDMIVRANMMRGRAGYGVYVSAGSNNLFIGNNLVGLDTPITYYFGEDTSGNRVVGYTGGCDSVVDLGTDNFIAGCTRHAAKQAAPPVGTSTWGRIKSSFK